MEINTSIKQLISNKYRNADKTLQEISLTTKHYQSLAPKKDSFVFNDGNEKELINLYGTIPVRYKGNTYNIPICVWLLDNYPLSAPMAYVKPTADMLIKASRHVDQSGKIYLPYLHEWDPNNSDLLGLVQIMIMIFAEAPPVYSKRKDHSPVHFSTPYPQHQQPGMTPVPTFQSSVPYPTGPSTAGSNLPYPTYGGPAPTPMSTQTPYPVYPPTSSYPPTPAAVTTPYPPAPIPGMAPYPPYPTATNAYNPAIDSSATVAVTTQSSGTITEEHIRASLISAANDLVRERLRDLYGTAQAEVSALRQQHTDLEKGRDKLEKLMKKLSVEQNELDKSIRHLKEKEHELEDVLSKVSQDSEPLDVDEAITTTAPIYKQLLTSYAEDQATQDAIYYLGEALRRNVIDLDSYLKHVRAMSRRQFQLRATMIKCRQKANLPG